MGTSRLKVIYPSKFLMWVKRSGFNTEFEFWSSLSVLSSGTVVDHMINYLSSLGYSGTPNDQFRKFLRDQTSNLGTTFDMGNQFFDGTFTGNTGYIKDDDGNFVKDDGGNKIIGI